MALRDPKPTDVHQDNKRILLVITPESLKPKKVNLQAKILKVIFVETKATKNH